MHHVFVCSTRNHELELLNQAKSHAKELDQQKVALEKADTFPETSETTEVGKMRAQILAYHNELVQCDDRQYQLEYKIEG